MPNTRAFCDQENHEHAIVPAIVDVRDNLGTLAVQVLAAKEDLSTMNYAEMLNKLYQIVSDLHTEYDHHKPTEYTGG
ncbi:hypothetical protein [uncultured Oscillibacter sp.]|uniref:hypothetical protein n=1 Tax=uncultured Oscillibacter sp. TaxID=876091 RepID=UPI002620967F|nr:hypothetical protein [uncultured Oscillibacter sp.]